jgi:quercetin dioxygenase-like cupin family protein
MAYSFSWDRLEPGDLPGRRTAEYTHAAAAGCAILAHGLADPARPRPGDVPEQRGSGYPEPFRSRMGDRAKRRLGDALGLTRFGVNLVTLAPGAQSALRHWHTLEDEFVWMLEGEVVLVTNGGEQLLRAGQCAGYPAGRATAITSSTAATFPRATSRSAAASTATTRSIPTTT